MHKKRFLRLISAVLALSMLTALLPTAAFADGTGTTPGCSSATGGTPTSQESFEFNCNKYTKKATLKKFTGNETEVLIPSSVLNDDGLVYQVTRIGDSAFQSCSSLTSVTIPEGVASIGTYVFYDCSSLESVTIPTSVKKIGGRAFYNCSDLTSVMIPEGVTSIENNTFRGCSKLTNVTIPGSVTSIGFNAFQDCSKLTNVTIPNSVTSISEEAFYGCSSLTNITIPSGVTSIEDSTFYGCSSLTSIAIPSGVTSIGSSAFQNCSSLTSIKIPSSVTSIGRNAFQSCSSLTSIAIPSGVTSIGSSAFQNCSSLTSIKIPSGVTSIERNTFAGCTSLTSITIPSSVTSIGDYAFYDCIRLESIKIPEGVTSIGTRAFWRCSSLTSVTIPEKVESIGKEAFNGCSSLESITIPASVTSIGRYALGGCTKLTTINFGGSAEDWKNLNVGTKVTPVCKLKTVSFDANGKTGVENMPTDLTVEYNNTITEPTTEPTVYGYTFGGWYTDVKCENAVNFDTSITEDITLYAKWTINKYTVSFDANGKTGVENMPTALTVEYNNMIAEPTPKPTVSNYIFDGWYKDTEGNTAFDFANDTVTENTTLYAKWTEKAVLTADKLKFENEKLSADADGVGEVTTRFYKVGEDGQFTGEPLDTLENAKYGLYQAEGTVTEGSLYKGGTLTSDKWQVFIAAPLEPGKPILYKIMVTGGKADKTEAKVGETVTLTADEPAEGELFDHWTVSGEKIEGNTFEMPAKDVTVKAVYTPKTYSVTFQTDHGTAPKAQTVAYKAKAAKPADLTAEGYTFGGWYTDKECRNAFDFEIAVTGNVTLYAKWTEVKKPEPKPDPEPEKPVTYAISVDNGKAYLEDGETEINTAEAGQTVVVRVNPEAITEGFEFDKWEIVSGEITLDDETASEIKFTMPAGEVELKATVKIKETPAVPLTPLEQAMATTAEVAVVGAGAAAVGVAVYGIGTELAARLLLPAGAAMPATTGELALLLWKHAGSPALPVEAPLSETETALRWAVEQSILNADDPAEKKVSAMDVIRAVRKNRK